MKEDRSCQISGAVSEQSSVRVGIEWEWHKLLVGILSVMEIYGDAGVAGGWLSDPM